MDQHVTQRFTPVFLCLFVALGVHTMQVFAASMRAQSDPVRADPLPTVAPTIALPPQPPIVIPPGPDAKLPPYVPEDQIPFCGKEGEIIHITPELAALDSGQL